MYSICDDSDADDLDFYRCTDKKLALGDKDKMPLSVLKHNIGKLKIDSDSKREYEEEEHLQFQILSTLISQRNKNYHAQKDAFFSSY